MFMEIITEFTKIQYCQLTAPKLWHTLINEYNGLRFTGFYNKNRRFNVKHLYKNDQKSNFQ